MKKFALIRVTVDVCKSQNIIFFDKLIDTLKRISISTPTIRFRKVIVLPFPKLYSHKPDEY